MFKDLYIAVDLFAKQGNTRGSFTKVCGSRQG
jgi:hypothetical protein